MASLVLSHPWRTVGRRRVLTDLITSARWRVSVGERRRQHEALRKCRTPDDLLGFARATFGITQHAEEIVPFIAMARAEKPRLACEIGTQRGGNNFLLSWAIPEIEQMIGLDLFVQNRLQLRHFRRKGLNLSLIDGSSHSERTVMKVKALLGGAKLDLLFIDGDHRYEGVLADFHRYRPLVRDGGLIAFHDIQPDGRDQGETRAFSGGVPDVWRHIRAQYPSQEFIRDRLTQRGRGIGVISYSPSGR